MAENTTATTMSTSNTYCPFMSVSTSFLMTTWDTISTVLFRIGMTLATYTTDGTDLKKRCWYNKTKKVFSSRTL